MFKVYIGLVASLFVAFAVRAAPAAPAPATHLSSYDPARPLPPDPAVRQGVLKNGVRYAVMHSDRAPGDVSLRFAIDVGSYEETEAERGLAHFIEHMAFRSTRSFPNNSVEGVFAPRGVAFGRDHNAETGLFSTQFQLDLTKADDKEIASGFRWLRDVADGVVFDDASVNTERGVVLAEKAGDHTVERDAQEALDTFESGALRSGQREPIGLEPVLRAATPAQLSAFHQRWYRPENAVVVMVSSLSADAMEALIHSSFDSWTAEGPPTARTALRGPDTGRGLDTMVVVEPKMLGRFEVCRVRAAETQAPQTMGRLRRIVLGEVWRSALNLRLEALRRDPANHIVHAEVGTDTAERDHRVSCLSVTPTGEDWSASLAATERELLRFGKAGPSEQEMDKAIEEVRSHIRGDVSNAANVTATDAAAGLVSAMLEGDHLVEDREAMKDFDLAVGTVTPAEITAAFTREWSGGGPLIGLISPADVKPEALRTAWTTTEGATGLAAYADVKALTWTYDFGAKGKVVSRDTPAGGVFVRIRFQNGVVLNFKKTSFEKDSATLQLTFGSGRREIPSRDYLIATFGGAVVSLGGTGKYSVDEIATLFQGDPQKFLISVGNDWFDVHINLFTANLDHQLRVLAAYMSDPGFRPSMDPLLHTGAELLERSYKTSLSLAGSLALIDAIAPRSPVGMPPKAELEAVNASRLSALLKPSMTGDPLQVTIVGDLTEKDAIDLVASTFGALPPRGAGVPKRTDTFYLTYPAQPGALIEATHEGPPDKALGTLIWPLYVATPSRRREENTINLLVAVFDDALRQRIRNELGKTYAPHVGAETPDYADEGSLQAEIEAAPADIAPLMVEARAIAARLARGEITAAQLEAARAPMIAAATRSTLDNGNWAATLPAYAADPRYLGDLTELAETLRSITLDEVKKAAADWLSKPPFETRVMPAAVASARGAVK